MGIEIDGIDIGETCAPIHPIIEKFARKGVQLAPSSISRLRSGGYNGKIIEDYRGACADLLRYGSPLRKNELYERIARRATDSDKRLIQKSHPNQYNSSGYSLRLSAALGISVVRLDEMFRCMRVEAATVTNTLPPNLLVDFNSLIYGFIDSYPPSRREKSPKLQQLYVLREGGMVFTPAIFYREIYKGKGTHRRFVGSCLPTEVEWFAGYYATKTEPPSTFSTFDIEVLRETGRANQASLPDRFEQLTGIPVNSNVIEIHTRALLGRIGLTD